MSPFCLWSAGTLKGENVQENFLTPEICGRWNVMNSWVLSVHRPSNTKMLWQLLSCVGLANGNQWAFDPAMCIGPESSLISNLFTLSGNRSTSVTGLLVSGVFPFHGRRADKKVMQEVNRKEHSETDGACPCLHRLEDMDCHGSKGCMRWDTVEEAKVLWASTCVSYQMPDWGLYLSAVLLKASLSWLVSTVTIINLYLKTILHHKGTIKLLFRCVGSWDDLSWNK